MKFEIIIVVITVLAILASICQDFFDMDDWEL